MKKAVIIFEAIYETEFSTKKDLILIRKALKQISKKQSISIKLIEVEQ